MAAPKPQHGKPGAGAPHEIRAAEEYVDQMLSSEEGNLSPDEIDSLHDSVAAIRRGEMTLAEFEQKYGL